MNGRYLVLALACAPAAVIAWLWMVLAALAGSRRALRVAIGFDQTLNAAIGGDEDETISARCWRLSHKWHYAKAARFIDWVFGQSGHCRDAYMQELSKRMNDGY